MTASLEFCAVSDVDLLCLAAGSTQQHWPFPTGQSEETGYAYILTHPGMPCIMWEHYFDHGFGKTIKHLVEVRYAIQKHSSLTHVHGNVSLTWPAVFLVTLLHCYEC